MRSSSAGVWGRSSDVHGSARAPRATCRGARSGRAERFPTTRTRVPRASRSSSSSASTSGARRRAFGRPGPPRLDTGLGRAHRPVLGEDALAETELRRGRRQPEQGPGMPHGRAGRPGDRPGSARGAGGAGGHWRSTSGPSRAAAPAPPGSSRTRPGAAGRPARPRPGFRSSRSRFSTRPSSSASASLASRTIAGTRVSPACWAARQRRSPTRISNWLPRGRTTSGWRMPEERIETASSSSARRVEGDAAAAGDSEPGSRPAAPAAGRRPQSPPVAGVRPDPVRVRASSRPTTSFASSRYATAPGDRRSYWRMDRP